MESPLSFQYITTADAPQYEFMEALMKQAFPEDEYRDLDRLRQYTDTHPRFKVSIIYDGEKSIGFIGHWIFDGFVYIEHFAVDAALRNHNYGSRALRQFCSEVNCPVVLEVEIPENELARRRIGFYERNGFVLWNNKYIQPAYRPDSASLEMRIMAYGEITPGEFSRVRELLYAEVYGVTQAGD